MHLTTFADLGLRSMMILGDLPEGQRLTISALAQATNASDNHLARVTAKLVDMGMVLSLIHISEPTRLIIRSRMPSSA